MKLRSFFSALAIVVGVLLLIGTGGFFWLTSQNPLSLLQGVKDANPAAAMFVPRQAPVMVSLLVNPDRLESFRQAVARPEERRRTRTELAQLKQGLLANTGLNYEQDVQPWLGGEATLAITTLDIDRDPANGQQPGYLLVLASQSPQRSREFLQLFWQKQAIAGTDLMFEQYKGVKLIYGNTPGNGKRDTRGVSVPKNSSLFSTDSSLASAVVGDQFVLFANHPKVLRDAITNVQAPDLSLNSADIYTQSLEALAQPRIGLTFVNLPRLADWLSTEANSRGNDRAAQDAVVSRSNRSSRSIQTLAIALEIDRRGLLAETALFSPDGDVASTPPVLSRPVGALQYIPATTPLSASGTNLEQLWSQLSQGLANYGTVNQLVSQPLDALKTQVGLDLPNDIFQWVKDEYALAVLPSAVAEGKGIGNRGQGTGKRASRNLNSKIQTLNGLQTDWIFVAQRPSQDQALEAIDRLDAIAKDQGISIGSVQLGEHTVSAWTRLKADKLRKAIAPQTLQAEVVAVHTFVGNYEIFASSLAAMEQALKTANASLAKDSRFQQAIAPLASSNNGYLYLDWIASQPLLERRFPLLKVIELAGQPVFKHLQSLTISSYGQDAGVQRGEVFIRLL